SNMKYVGFFLLFFLATTLGVLSQQTNDWTWGGPIDPLQEKITIKHYQLDLEFTPEKQWIQGSVKVSFDCGQKLDTLRLNLIASYEVTKVEFYHDEPGEIRHFGDTSDIFVPNGCAEQATIYYQWQTPIDTKPPWTRGFTCTKDSRGTHSMGLSSQ